MTLKFLAFDAAVRDLLFEHPEGKVSKVLLGNFYDVNGKQSVCEIFFGSLIFLN